MSNDYVKDFTTINNHELYYNPSKQNDLTNRLYVADLIKLNYIMNDEWFNWQYLKEVEVNEN